MKILAKLLSDETNAAIDALLGAELSAQVDGLLKDVVIDPAKEKLIPKAKFDAEREKSADYLAQIAERDKQLETLKTSAKDNESFSAQIKQLQEANDAAAKEYAAKLAETERDYALKDALKNTYKARDVLSVMPHLKQDAITFKDGEFIGLKEQMEALSKDKAFLFETDDVPPGTSAPVLPPDAPKGGGFDFGFAAVRDVKN